MNFKKITKNLIILFFLFTITLSIIFFATPKDKIHNDNYSEDITIDKIEGLKGKDLKNEMHSVFLAVQNIDKSPNNELQKYVREQEYLKNNKIILTAEKNSHGDYISSRIESVFSFKYGDFSFKIKDLKNKGLFSAIWLLPADGENYPEIDIYEHVGNNNNEVNGVNHYAQGEKYYFTRVANDDTYIIDFHWSKDLIAWSIDGKEVFRSTEMVPNEEMFMIMNLAVGGNWPGNPDKSTKFPSDFEIEVLEFKPQNISVQKGILNAN